MSKKIIIESLAMDLKRVALGLQRGSVTMAKRFKEEALKREEELEAQHLNNYLQKLLINVRKVLISKNGRVAEDALMYSTLFQNFARKYLFRQNLKD